MSTMAGAAIGGDELLQRASALVPVLAERALVTEQQRRIPDETIKDLVGVGLLRIAHPARYGGSGLDYDTVIEVGAGPRPRPGPRPPLPDRRHLVRLGPSRHGQQGHRHRPADLRRRSPVPLLPRHGDSGDSGPRDPSAAKLPAAVLLHLSLQPGGPAA